MSDTVAADRAASRPAPRHGRRRRPSGEPPPLPHHLRTTGVGWLIGTVLLWLLAVIYFGRGLEGAAVPLTVVDDTIVRVVGNIDIPGLLGLAQAVNTVASF